MSFGESPKKWVANALFFLSPERRTTSATFLGSISAKLPTNTCPGVARSVSYSRKVSIKGSNLPKTLFLGYPVYAQPTGHRKCSATPTLFPSPSGHPTDLSFLVTFAVGCTVFHLSTPESVLISNGHTWMGTQSRHLVTLLNRPIIFPNITRQVAPPSRIADMQWYNNPLHIF